ncbi:DUF1189 domain-containing protein [Priestia megaterium]|nr:DUF1189 domain-containing protein [Priestia megaterium]
MINLYKMVNETFSYFLLLFYFDLPKRSSPMNIFQRLLISTSSLKKMSALRFEHPNKTIGYVSLLTFLSLLPAMFFMIFTILSGYHISIHQLSDKNTDFYIQDFKLYDESATNNPLTLSTKYTNFIFDPLKTSQDIAKNPPSHAVGFLHDGLFITTNGRLQTYSYELLSWEDLNKKQMLSKLTDFKSFLIIFIPFSITVLYVLTAGLKFIQITCFALIGKIITYFLKKNLSYKHLWVLSAYSTTPMTLIFMVLSIFPSLSYQYTSLYWIGTILVYTLTIHLIPSRKKTNKKTPLQL